MDIIEKALQNGQAALSEYDSKQVLASYKIPITKEIKVNQMADLDRAAQDIGYPLVLKGCSAEITHKTEKGLIQVDIRNKEEASAAFQDIISKIEEKDKSVLVQEMVKGQRELVVGMTRDQQFGPCVMFGLGGIFTEILHDVSFRVAPLMRRDALDMMNDFKGHKILDAVRGMEAVDREVLADILLAVGQIGLDYDGIQEIDINPLKIRNGQPIAVDALVVLKK